MGNMINITTNIIKNEFNRIKNMKSMTNLEKEIAFIFYCDGMRSLLSPNLWKKIEPYYYQLKGEITK